MIARRPARRMPAFHPLISESAPANHLGPLLEAAGMRRAVSDRAASLSARSRMCRCWWNRRRPAGDVRGEIVMVHGLEGSGRAVYIRSLSAAALSAGFAVHRFNMRTCGGTEQLCQTLYHAGLTSDLLIVLRELGSQGRGPMFLVGVFAWRKCGGETGWRAGRTRAGVARVEFARFPRLSIWRLALGGWPSPTIAFTSGASCGACASDCAPPAGTAADFAGLKTVSGIDDRITAPSFGFGNAANYYRTQSAMRFLDGLRVPGAADLFQGRYAGARRRLSTCRRCGRIPGSSGSRNGAWRPSGISRPAASPILAG